MQSNEAETIEETGEEDAWIYVATSYTLQKYDLHFVSATTNLEKCLTHYNKDKRDRNDFMYYVTTIKSKKTKTLIGCIKRILDRNKCDDNNLFKLEASRLKTFVEAITHAYNKDTSVISDTYQPGLDNLKDVVDRVYNTLV